MSAKAATLTQKSNQYYEKVGKYNSTMVPALNKLCLAFGVSAGCSDSQINQLASLNLSQEQIALLRAPFNIAHVEALSSGQLAAISKGIAPVIEAIGKEVSEHTFNADITAIDYVDLAALIADLPNQLAGDSITIVRTNYEKIAELLALCDSLMDAQGLTVAKIIRIKNKVSEIAETLDKVR